MKDTYTAAEARELFSKEKKPLRIKPEKKVQPAGQQTDIADRSIEEEVMSRLFLRYEGYVEIHPDHFRITYKGRVYILRPVAVP